MRIKTINIKILGFIVFTFLLIVSGILSPLIIKKYAENWDSVISNEIEYSAKFIKNFFAQKEKLLLNFNKKVKRNIWTLLLKGDYNSFLKDYQNADYIIQVFNSNKDLILWNSNEYLYQIDELKKENLNQCFFFDNDLIVYLSLIDTINIGKDFFFFSINLPAEKRYKLSNEEKVSWSEFLSQKLNTNVQITFSSISTFKDGRNYSFDLYNSQNKKICSVILEKPALDNAIGEIKNSIKIIQFILLLVIFFNVVWLLFPKINEQKKKIIKFGTYVLIAFGFRMLLFLSNIPSLIFKSSITEASYFSSKFAYGIVRSPLEFTITVSIVSLLIVVAFKYVIDYYTQHKIRTNWLIFILLTPGIFFIILLTWRGLGASLRSVIFDSTIRYFKELIIIPDAPTFLMDFNILLLGFSAIIFSLLLLLFLFSFNPLNGKNTSLAKLLLILFLCLQVSGFLFDAFQKQPQGTPLIRIIYISVIFLLFYFIVFENIKGILKYVCIAFGASVATVGLLTYYNFELEKESLKTIAQDLTRTDKNIYQFLVYQTLFDIVNNEDIANAYIQNKNMNSAAFRIWTKSLLYRESIPTLIGFYNSKKKLIGSFVASKYKIETDIFKNSKKDYDEICVEIVPNIYGSGSLIIGKATIKLENKILGYTAVGVLANDVNMRYTSIPEYFLAEQQNLASALNIERVKIFYFSDGELIQSNGLHSLSEKDKKRFLNASFSRYNESWMNILLGDENHLFYLLKIGTNKVIAVGKEEKNLTWNLSDFFKVFFIHSFIIFVCVLFVALTNIKTLKYFFQGYRTKIVAAFIVVSIIPLLIIAVYFKNLTDANNEEIIIKNITNLNNQLQGYLKKYQFADIKDPNIIFQKALQELNIHFSLFKNKHLVFSTVQNIYDVGLISKIIPFKIYLDIFYEGKANSYYKSELERKFYYSLYSKFDFNDVEYILEINNLFNEYDLAFSKKELNIFMFGTISLAAIMIIIFSSILANQISKPIRKLTLAARAVGSGDLNVKISGNYSGEVSELIKVFNKMVQQLKKSQIQIAKLERETAWKEMAKQVAHEIKNPLTPMKLSIQQLITAYQDKSAKFEQIFNKVTSTIINQIEVLKNIATEFSNYARMPALNIDKISLKKVIENSINLFADEKVNIKYSIVNNDIIINADEEHLCRTFINLIRNSLQAEAKNIFIMAEEKDAFCILRISDDGSGIPIENIDRIFDENFTTKKYGMGLGLSIAKKFLNSIEGSIEVEKTSVDGTTFLIKIPLAK